MARKGKETDVQVFVKTDEEWEKLKELQVIVGVEMRGTHSSVITYCHHCRVSSPWWTSTVSGPAPASPCPTTSRRSSWR